MTGPKVDLISHTPFPLETLYAFWHASRTDGPTLTAYDINVRYFNSTRGVTNIDDARFYVGGTNPNHEPFHTYFDREVLKIAALDFPLKETILFSFVFSDVTITWREQAVRQRKATAWSQTSRTRDLSNFVDNGWFEEPLSVAGNERVHATFMSVINSIQKFYRIAREEGIHQEDARCLQPTCQTHRIAFAYNARVLEQTMEDRLCFIAQADLWTPIIRQIQAHVLRVDPRLALLFHPPCIKGGVYRYCPVAHENERRMDGRDPMGPCPLWAWKEVQDDARFWDTVPHRANAEAQYAKIRDLWPERERIVIDDWISR